MKKATISELKNHLSRYLRYVKQGEPVLVLDRGMAVADILPHKTHKTDTNLMLRLESKGVVRRGDVRHLKNYCYPDAKSKPTGALAALLAERSQSR